MIFLYIILGVVWCVIGAVFFIHCWTKDCDLTTTDIPLVVAAALLGPVGSLFFAYIFCDQKVIIKQRGAKCSNKN